eukprot:352675-Chlamydomonas_euryale.AAC.2
MALATAVVPPPPMLRGCRRAPPASVSTCTTTQTHAKRVGKHTRRARAGTTIEFSIGSYGP